MRALKADKMRRRQNETKTQTCENDEQSIKRIMYQKSEMHINKIIDTIVTINNTITTR